MNQEPGHWNQTQRDLCQVLIKIKEAEQIKKQYENNSFFGSLAEFGAAHRNYDRWQEEKSKGPELISEMHRLGKQLLDKEFFEVHEYVTRIFNQ